MAVNLPPRTSLNWEDFWKKFIIYTGAIISFLTIIGFLITLSFNLISLGEKVGILEGQMTIQQHITPSP